MSEPLRQYCTLLDEYHALIVDPNWWDGRREALVEQMDAVWVKLTKKEQDVDQFEYQKALYAKLLEVRR